LFKIFIPPVDPYWYLLQAIALILPLHSIFTPLLGGFLIVIFSIKQGWRSLDNSINRGWLALSGWLIITTLTAFDPAVAWTGLFNFLPFFLLFAIAQTLIQTSKQFEHLLRLLILSSIPISTFGLLQVIINQPDWKFPRLFNGYDIGFGMSADNRIKSLFGHYNEFGIYLALILTITIGSLGKNLKAKNLKTKNLESQNSEPKNSDRLLNLLALGLGLIAISYSGSRNAIALFGIGIVALAIYNRYWYVVGGLVTSLCLLLWAAWGQLLGIGGEWLRVLFPMAVISRLESTINNSQGNFASTGDRLNAWKFATELIQARPIQGWGLRSFELIAKSMNFDLRGLPHEHNFYLTLAVGGGIPLLMGFVLLVGWIIGQSLNSNLSKIRSPIQNLIFATVVAIALFFLSGLLDVVFYETRVTVLVWILLGAISGMSVQRHSSGELHK
jgi:O-antigen ligase